MQSYDAVLMNLQMSEMDGLQVTRILHEQDRSDRAVDEPDEFIVFRVPVEMTVYLAMDETVAGGREAWGERDDGIKVGFMC